MELKKAIEIIKNHIKIDKTYRKSENSDYDKFCDEQVEAMQILLNELERLQKENSNISRELIHRTDELNKLLEENKRLNGKIKRYTRYLENKDKKMEELLEYEYTEREQDYIPKQVIQDKIEELEKEYDKEYHENYYGAKQPNKIPMLSKAIDILKEILGDE